MILRDDITGLVLAGGRGSRMASRDKGLELLDGEPLVAHALRRLEPQVATLLVSANRHRERYAAFGHRVIADADDTFQGPLAGIAAALDICATPWIVTVPCDAPFFPHDLVNRLADGIGQADAAFVRSPARLHPVFCLVRAATRTRLAPWLAQGRRDVRGWLSSLEAVEVTFADDAAFANLNTLDDLKAATRAH